MAFSSGTLPLYSVGISVTEAAAAGIAKDRESARVNARDRIFFLMLIHLSFQNAVIGTSRAAAHDGLPQVHVSGFILTDRPKNDKVLPPDVLNMFLSSPAIRENFFAGMESSLDIFQSLCYSTNGKDTFHSKKGGPP